MEHVLVWGYGSIGQRHSRVLDSLSCSVGVVSARNIEAPRAYKNIQQALDEHAPSYVIISNATASHIESIETLASLNFRGKVLVEKPLSAHPIAIPQNEFSALAVAYNLRFHPLLAAMREKLLSDRLISLSIACGQLLSTWRADRDYRSTYSASVKNGGGVLRDLSHELDYLSWIAGPWKRLTALGGNYGALNITADESWSILIELESGAEVVVRLNYLDQPPRREIVATTERSTLKADFISCELMDSFDVHSMQVDRDYTYEQMHRAMLANDMSTVCSVEEAVNVNRLITAIEQAATQGVWVKNDH